MTDASRLRRDRLAWAFLALALLAAPAIAEPAADDPAFLQGYIAAILERDVGLSPQAYTLNVSQGVVQVRIARGDPAQEARIREALAPVIEERQLALSVTPSDDEAPVPPVHYPVGDLFLPLIANPKEPQFFMSWLEVDAPRGGTVSIGAVGLGETFGLVRWPDATGHGGWQLDFFGAVFSQFNLDADSYPLLNTDYLVGFPLTWRHDEYSARMRLYHQSSHLGDELLLSGQAPKRIDLSVEVVDGLLARDFGPWRLYGGGGYLVHRSPGELAPWFAEAGTDYRARWTLWPEVRLVGGVNLASLEERDWEIATSIEVGIAIGREPPGGRGTRLMLQFFDGPAPFGQFYAYDLRYLGVGWFVNL